MGKTSKIEWTDATWNPWRGCKKISEGCRHCYMFREQRRYGRDPQTVVRSKTTFGDPLRWHESKTIFTCSWSDFFIAEADEWRPEAWDIIKRTPQHTYLILTKRPANIVNRLPNDWFGGWSNVWLGVSVENQRAAVERIPVLLDIPAAVRFVSAEPLLGAIDFGFPMVSDCAWLTDIVIDWVIVGGESGPGARPVNPEWVRDIRDQCKAAGVLFFFKQWGGVTKGAAGRALDGRTWDEIPPVRG